MIYLDQLHKICPYTPEHIIAPFVDPLNAAMKEFEIDQTGPREAMFIAQLCHESGGFRYVEELASGAAYEGRKDLGNTEPGDGVKFKGRGLIQITGRSNYRTCGDALGVDLLSDPPSLERHDLACRSAGWFWSSRGLNELSDKGDFRMITKRINGGLNGWQDRLQFYEKAQQVL